MILSQPGRSQQALQAAAQFLAAHQDPDGFWRDYLLPPGPSTAWTTACVAWSLATGAQQSAALQAADQALHSIRKTGGWGYNSSTAIDADSTAWVLRFMARIQHPCIRDATLYLSPFIAQGGGVRTFQSQRFGSWAHQHADVTPVAGLALLECGGDRDIVQQLRSWSLANQSLEGHWHSFWWSTDAYATARNLEFLAASGGLTDTVIHSARRWLANQSTARSSFEAAHHLIISTLLKTASHELAANLLSLQMPDGGWPASTVLQVPDQVNAAAPPSIHADSRRLMSTAMALHALSTVSSSEL
jgi:hypothetical protein